MRSRARGGVDRIVASIIALAVAIACSRSPVSDLRVGDGAGSGGVTAGGHTGATGGRFASGGAPSTGGAFGSGGGLVDVDAGPSPDGGVPVDASDDASDDAGPDVIRDDAGIVLGSTDFCSDDGWCWEYPRPQGNDLHAAWVDPGGLLFAAGDAGTLLGWDGARFTSYRSGTRETLRGLSGVARNDVWACGDAGTLLHFDGEAWRAIATGTDVDLRGVWAAGPDDAWIVGNSGTLLHAEGTRITPVTTYLFEDLVGIAAGGGAVWVVGSYGLIQRLHAGVLSTVFQESGFGDLTATWVSPDGELFATGPSSYVVRCTTDGCTYDESLPGNHRAIAGTSASDVWIAGYEPATAHWDGSTWTEVDLTARVRSLVEGPGGRLVGVGEGGRVVVFDSGVPRIVNDDRLGGFNAAWGSGPSDVWFAHKRGGFVHYDGTFTDMPLWARIAQGIHGTGPRDVWAAGLNDTLLHWDGASWTDFAEPPPVTMHFRGVWAAAPDDVWAVGERSSTPRDYGHGLHWDGTAWTDVTFDPAAGLYTIFPAGAGRAHAGDGAGNLFTWDGAAWTREATGGAIIAGVAPSADTLWLVRGSSQLSSTVLSARDGDEWTQHSRSRYMNAVWAAGPTDGYVVGSSGSIDHFDGRTLTAEDSGAPLNWLQAVWGASADDVWAAGDQGILRKRR